MMPWYRGFRVCNLTCLFFRCSQVGLFFKGTIRKVGDHRYEVAGVAEKTSPTTVEITELPIGKWNQAYKTDLEAMLENDKEGGSKIKASPFCILVQTGF